MILWNYINFNTHIYKLMVMNIAIIFNDFFLMRIQEFQNINS
jgi:hypothetical protein